MADRWKFHWSDVLGLAGAVFAAYVLVYLFRSATWPQFTMADLVFGIASVGVGIASMYVSGFCLAEIVRAISPPGFGTRRFGAMVAANKTVLNKYIPGKIWYVVGISETLARTGVPRTTAWIAVAVYQFVLIATAMLLGLLGVMGTDWMVDTIQRLIPGDYRGIGVVVIAIIAFVGVAVQRYVRRTATRQSTRFLPRLIGIAVCWATMFWVLQGVAIWLFLWAWYGEAVSQWTILIVPAVYACGFVVFIAPGGLGVRELLFVQYFLGFDIPLEEAASLAVAARIGAALIDVGAWLSIRMILMRVDWNGVKKSR